MNSKLGAGIFGFGLAHIVLGLLDAAFNRRSVAQREGPQD